MIPSSCAAYHVAPSVGDSGPYLEPGGGWNLNPKSKNMMYNPKTENVELIGTET